MAGRDKVICGDCKQPLPHGAQSSRRGRVAESEPYCPDCNDSTPEALACPHCGSGVCAKCGSILESPEDLGYG